MPPEKNDDQQQVRQCRKKNNIEKNKGQKMIFLPNNSDTKSWRKLLSSEVSASQVLKETLPRTLVCLLVKTAPGKIELIREEVYPICSMKISVNFHVFTLDGFY